MFLLEPGETNYDLNFRVFGVEVRVHPMFWLVSAVMGFGYLEFGIAYFLLWMGCYFFSMMIHELGHVLMFGAFGTRSHIVLYAFGGMAIPHGRIYIRWQRIIVSVAGPFANLLVLVVMTAALTLQNPDNFRAMKGYISAVFGILTEDRVMFDLSPIALLAVMILVRINLSWALLNLLPIFPLDGGHISRDFLEGALPSGQGTRISLIISLVVAAIFTVHSLLGQHGTRFIPFLPPFGVLGAILFAMLAVQSFQMLQEQSNPPWRREG